MLGALTPLLKLYHKPFQLLRRAPVRINLLTEAHIGITSVKYSHHLIRRQHPFLLQHCLVHLDHRTGLFPTEQSSALETRCAHHIGMLQMICRGSTHIEKDGGLFRLDVHSSILTDSAHKVGFIVERACASVLDPTLVAGLPPVPVEPRVARGVRTNRVLLATHVHIAGSCAFKQKLLLLLSGVGGLVGLRMEVHGGGDVR